jgi:hypothetical protein
VEEVKSIHSEIVERLGGKPGIHNDIDLQYAINHPLTDFVGVPKQSPFERICNCTYLLGRCFVDCGAQVSATIFLLLCGMNGIKINFKLGDIYDIFRQIVGPNIDRSSFIDILKRYHESDKKVDYKEEIFRARCKESRRHIGD